MSGSEGRPRGLVAILVATAVAGVAGYIVQGVVGAALEDGASYLRFSVFWSTLYLVIAALSGAQQEVTRASRATNTARLARAPARVFAILACSVVIVAIPVTSLFWGPAVFPGESWQAVAALTIGAAAYVLVAVLSGVLYGLSQWTVIATITSVDGLLRLLFTVVVSIAWPQGNAFIWAVVLPFPLSILLVWPFVRRRVIGRYSLDVRLGGLAWNSARTVIASVAIGIIVSGFPLVVDITSRHDAADAVGVLVLAITLTRAPLVVPLMALQSYLTVYFRDRLGSVWRFIVVCLLAVVGIAVAAAVVAGLIGPWLLTTVFGPAYELDGLTVAMVVASAGLTAALCISGPAVLAKSDHGAYVTGWVVAAVALVLLLLLPLELTPRVILALSAGPAIGLVVHLVALARSRDSRSATPGAPPLPSVS